MDTAKKYSTLGKQITSALNTANRLADTTADQELKDHYSRIAGYIKAAEDAFLYE